MKNKITKIVAALLIMVCCFSLSGCSARLAIAGDTDNSQYQKDLSILYNIHDMVQIALAQETYSTINDSWDISTDKKDGVDLNKISNSSFANEVILSMGSSTFEFQSKLKKGTKVTLKIANGVCVITISDNKYYPDKEINY